MKVIVVCSHDYFCAWKNGKKGQIHNHIPKSDTVWSVWISLSSLLSNMTFCQLSGGDGSTKLRKILYRKTHLSGGSCNPNRNCRPHLKLYFLHSKCLWERPQQNTMYGLSRVHLSALGGRRVFRNSTGERDTRGRGLFLISPSLKIPSGGKKFAASPARQ